MRVGPQDWSLCPYKETPESSLAPSAMWGWRSVNLGAALPGPQTCRCLDRTSSLQSCEWMLLNRPGRDVLPEPERAKTGPASVSCLQGSLSGVFWVLPVGAESTEPCVGCLTRADCSTPQASVSSPVEGRVALGAVG